MLSNCGAGEDFWESLGLQGDTPVHPKWNQSWIFIERTDAKAEAPILWPPDGKNWIIGKDQWLKAGGKEDKIEGGKEDNRGWDGWVASLTRWTWVWLDSGSWWWKGSPGVLQFMGSQRLRHDWVTELNWTDENQSSNKHQKPIKRVRFLIIPWKDSVGISWLDLRWNFTD